ncbi:uncharacterized protein LOC106177098 [Lingula anatina]|uniref:Uncharacterized protein LOC106177098 n=1 Tax=Lingula anatina TaxID=7574 RepID=A0A1S3JY47_LINAN|nr:uncharacterized protein LOC106177098 [Lingula anatina]XP_013415233.1 uncharacterized protein LOC106177098 [Lingula anatina]|eukprot:XP_013415232.1 uncharacterized protein LOC106177098 [Lingula anatina]
MCDLYSCKHEQELKRVKKECDGLYEDLKKVKTACCTVALHPSEVGQSASFEQTKRKGEFKLSEEYLVVKKELEKLTIEKEQLKAENALLKKEATANKVCISQELLEANKRAQKEIDRLITENAYLKLNSDKNMEILIDHWKQKCENMEKENIKLKQKLVILEREAEIYQSVGRLSGMNEQQVEQMEMCKVSRFRARPISQEAPVKECSRCHQFFIAEEQNAGHLLCEYHEFPPVDFPMWSRLLPGEVVEALVVAGCMGFKYWICCDQLQKRRPQGCKYGPHKFH